MKILYSITLLISTFYYSQIPLGYYNTATGNGYTLKTQLNYIITNGHIDQGYGSGLSTINNGLWTAYSTTDRDIFFENDNSILDIYSENPLGSDPYFYNYNTNQCSGSTPTNEGGCYNREHLVPQSYFKNVTTSFVKNDPHFVIPTDLKVNAWRNNYPFGKVSGTVNLQCLNSNVGNVNNVPCKTLNGSQLGTNSNSGYSAGYTGVVFEPIDEFKGDVARSILYFATRYENLLTSFYNHPSNNSASKIMFDGSSGKSFSTTFLNILLTWSLQDPVSPREIYRNNAIYNFQNNRNPYIDHPEYVTTIWGTLAGIENIEYQPNEFVEVYPTLPKNNKIYVKSLHNAQISSVLIFNQFGQQVKVINNYNNLLLIEINMLNKKGIYFIKILGKGMEVNRLVIIK